MEARGCAGLLRGVKLTPPLLQRNQSQSLSIKLSAGVAFDPVGSPGGGFRRRYREHVTRADALAQEAFRQEPVVSASTD
jgi:hypothetical protein